MAWTRRRWTRSSSRTSTAITFPGSSRVEHRFATRFVEWRDRAPQELGGVSMTPFEVVHASGAPPYALRIVCDGKVVAYSGDSSVAASS